jgi:hypothetical protein
MAFSYQVTTSDPSNSASSQLPVLRYDLEQALAGWSQYLTGPGTLIVNLVIASTATGRASGGTTAVRLTGAASGGNRVVEDGSEFALRTGQHLAASDITVTFDTAYFPLLDFTPNLTATSVAAPGKLNPISVMLHEIGHGLGISGYYSQSGVLPANDVTEFDTFIRQQNGSATFQGENARFAYGGDVPLTTASTTQNYYHFGNTLSDMSRTAATVQDPLTLDLMNGVVFFPAHPYVISALNVAVMQDLGYQLSPEGMVFAHTVTNRTASATITGTSSDDIVNALGGQATVTGRGGNDTLNGAGLSNTAAYQGAARNYQLTFTNGSSAFQVEDKVGAEGTDTIAGFQRLQFADQAIDATIFTKAAALSPAQLGSLVELYVASFNRAPDALGLDYWGSRLHDGMSLGAIAGSFFVQPEAAAFYPASQTTQAFVAAVYGNVLNRAPDAAGLDYWVGQLQSGQASKDSFLLAIVNGAKSFPGSADTQVLANKQSVGSYFALMQGLSDTADARAVMANVGASSASVFAAWALTDTFALQADTAATTELVVRIVGIAG